MKKVAQYGQKMMVIDEATRTAQLYVVEENTWEWRPTGEATQTKTGLTDEQLARLLAAWREQGSLVMDADGVVTDPRPAVHMGM